MLKDHSAESVDEAIDELLVTFGNKYNDVFNSITSDNGSEFANLSRLEKKRIDVYFTHPYTSCEKPSVECHNRMLRRFIPKGKSINSYTADDIMIFADIINGLPRKILGYHTPLRSSLTKNLTECMLPEPAHLICLFSRRYAVQEKANQFYL